MPRSDLSEPLFRRLIGSAFDDLPSIVRDVHSGERTTTHRGTCEVLRGGGILSRLCGAVAGFPPAGSDVPISVEIAITEDAETWRRDFGGHEFRSYLREAAGELEERIGPSVFRFRLVPDACGIRWELVGMRVLGIPVPRFA